MKRNILTLFLAVLLVAVLLTVGASANSTTDCSGGDSCTHEAEIGNTHYDTLAEAISASQPGQTIELLEDIDNSIESEDYSAGVNYSLKTGTTLDGNGHTISGHIGVYIPADGATVKDVKFENIHNNTEVSEADCKKYGWESKTGNQSAVYASGLTGKAVIKGCTFDNIDWDAIQITPTKTAEIVITDNVFKHTDTTSTQLRYVHVEYTVSSFGTAISGLTVTDNQFFTSKNTGDSFCSIGVWRVNKNTDTLQLTGNYVEDYATTEVSVIGLGYLFPARTTPDVDMDDYQPVAYNGTEVYFTLQDAIDRTDKYVRLMADASGQTAVIPAGKTISFYPYGHAIGTLTNNGDLTVYGSDLAGSSTIINNGTLSLSGNSATVYVVENNGTLLITSGVTYDLSKITNNGTVSITGGTFSTKLADAWLAPWYKVTESGSPVVYKVSKMNISDGVDAGMVATSGSSSGDYYKSVAEGLNSTKYAKTYLQTDSAEDVVISTPYEGGRSLYSNKHSFTGSIVIEDNCDFLNLLGSNFNLKYAEGDRLRIGFYSTAANVTIQNADLNLLEVSASGDCTVEGGYYGEILIHEYYAKRTDTEPKYAAELAINGGYFESNIVTKKYTDIRPEGLPATEELPITDFLAPELVYELNNNGVYSYYKTAEAALAEAKPGAVISYIGGDAPQTGYTVTIKYGNSQPDTIVNYVEGTIITLPSAPTKPGYIFMGWKYGDATYQAGEKFTVTGDMTFTAVWANMPDITPGTPDTPDEPDALPFTDVHEGQWFYEAVKYVYGAGIMNGMDRYTFQPNGTLTRAMVWTMLARLDGVDTEGGATWYAKAQAWAMDKGVSDGTEPMAEITREQLVTMLYRFAEMNGADMTQGGMGIREYEDYAEISDWALTAMAWAVNNGIIEGDAGALKPTSTCTRAEAAAMFMRSCNNIL